MANPVVLSCERCDENVEKKEQHRKTVLKEFRAELTRVNDRLKQAMEAHDDAALIVQRDIAKVRITDDSAINIAWGILDNNLHLKSVYCYAEEVRGDLHMISEDYHAAVADNLLALALRDLCNRGMTVDHEDF